MEKRALVLTTLAAALFLFSVAVIRQLREGPAPVIRPALSFIGKPSAKLEIIVIEDFRCHNCRKFSEQILPEIHAKYVQSGKARLTLVPIAFLAGSQKIANAVLEVYQSYPEQFVSFLKAVSQKGEGEILSVAKMVGGIDLAKLQTCMEKGSHDQELERNLKWAHSFNAQ